MPVRDRKEYLTMAASLRNDPALSDLFPLDQDKAACCHQRCELLQGPVFCQRPTGGTSTGTDTARSQHGGPPPGRHDDVFGILVERRTFIIQPVDGYHSGRTREAET